MPSTRFWWQSAKGSLLGDFLKVTPEKVSDPLGGNEHAEGER